MDGVVVSSPDSDCRRREAAGDNEVPLSTCEKDLFGGISEVNDTRDASAVFPLRRGLAESNVIRGQFAEIPEREIDPGTRAAPDWLSPSPPHLAGFRVLRFLKKRTTC